MFGLGMPEIIVILIVALIIFGPDKLPEMARGIGKGIQEFKNLTMGVERQMKDEFEAIIQEGEEKPSPAPNIDVQTPTPPPPTTPPVEVKTTKIEETTETPKEEAEPVKGQAEETKDKKE